MRTGLFPVVATAAAALALGADSASARTFLGSGDAFLKVPGCRSVSRVLVGNIEIPAYITQKFPTDNDAKEHVATDWPLYDLSQDETGQPVLLRSVQSNDGIWQEGVEITVVGEWEPEVEKAANAAKTTKSKPEGQA